MDRPNVTSIIFHRACMKSKYSEVIRYPFTICNVYTKGYNGYNEFLSACDGGNPNVDV